VSGDPVSRRRLRLWLRLLRLTRETEAELRARMREAGTTLPRFDVMAALARSPDGMGMGELSASLKVSGGNVTPLVDRLEAEGLVERVAVAGDRRRSLARLTEAGAARFRALAARHAGWIDEMFGEIGEAEVDAALAALAKAPKRTTAEEPAA
jgi:DNA-binding MarR family transcriptional regulator